MSKTKRQTRSDQSDAGVSESTLLELLRAKRRAGRLAEDLRVRPFAPATVARLQEYLARDAGPAAHAFRALCADPERVRQQLRNLGVFTTNDGSGVSS